MIEILNNQRKIKSDWQYFRAFAENAAGQIPETRQKSIAIVFVSDRKMRELNKKFRGKNLTTDVLSFPYTADEFNSIDAGEIVISAEQALRQSIGNNLTLETEIKQLILHGILHLCGYDHENDAGEMNALELGLRDKLGIE
jgi:probable rRNA maturation factor